MRKLFNKVAVAKSFISLKLRFNGFSHGMDIRDLTFRSANSNDAAASAENARKSYEEFFKPGIRPYVEALNGGEWPENPDTRWYFFRKGFKDADTVMISHKGVDIGCACLARMQDTIELKRIYLREDYQRVGIGAYYIAKGLYEAHKNKKGFELEVLANNEKAIRAYTRAGFIQCSDIIRGAATMVDGVEISEAWNVKFKMVHKDTVQYLPEAHPYAAYLRQGAISTNCSNQPKR